MDFYDVVNYSKNIGPVNIYLTSVAVIAGTAALLVRKGAVDARSRVNKQFVDAIFPGLENDFEAAIKETDKSRDPKKFRRLERSLNVLRSSYQEKTPSSRRIKSVVKASLDYNLG